MSRNVLLSSLVIAGVGSLGVAATSHAAIVFSTVEGSVTDSAPLDGAGNFSNGTPQ